MKRLLPLLLLTLLLASPALAENKTFGPFTVDVPFGWTTEYSSDSGNATLFLTKGSAEVGFGMGLLENESFTTYMDYIIANPEDGAGAPQKQADGSWTIALENNETKLKGNELYKAVGKYVFIQRVMGEDPDIDGILASFKLDVDASF